ncbi:hypothetical protein [Aureispira anguillae]|uniref:Uncharacterized protein n=1 Tax=Aureispira anguillae TaxID=2864201 RepID=A0A915VKC8_9BACT|nr:hypothetical protein [Aureispira anguillae]BDS09637.1 hypothetical protein AsAng_0003410 [Aureispira anguillae]
MSNDNTDTNETNTTAQNLSTKDKFLDFVNQNTIPLIVGTTIFIVIILLVVVYNAFLNPTSMEDFAEKFCNCTDKTENVYYNYSKDGFGYNSNLTGCFAEEFRLYSEGYNKDEKKKLLVEFQQAVIKKCPKKLANAFEYK